MNALAVLALVALLGLVVTLTAIVLIMLAERRVRAARRPRHADIRVPQQRVARASFSLGAASLRRSGH